MSSRRIDFNEPLPQMIERLKSEHRSFDSKLAEIQGSINNNDIIHATEIIRGMPRKVTHHAVEEEARLMRVIMQKAKNESPESIKIMQEHNWVMDFFKNKLEAIENRINSGIDSKSYGDKKEQSKKELREFITNLRSHFSEEEQIVFPLALKASFMIITSMPTIAAALIMTYTDRIGISGFFNPALWGDPIAYQHLFWFTFHPEVYIFLISTIGMLYEMVPKFSRKLLFSYQSGVTAFVLLGTISFRHLFASWFDSINWKKTHIESKHFKSASSNIK